MTTTEKASFRVTPSLRARYGASTAMEMAVSRIRTAYHEMMGGMTGTTVVVVAIAVEHAGQKPAPG